MTVVLRSICKYYFQGQAVDKGADCLIDYCFTKDRNEEERTNFNQKYRTKVKTSVLYLGTSAVVIATFANPLLSLPAACATGTVGSIPFVKPLISNLKTRVKNFWYNVPFCAKIKNVAVGALFIGAHGSVTYIMSQHMERNHYTPASLALSNLTVPCCELVNELLSCSTVKRRVSPPPSRTSPNEHSPLRDFLPMQDQISEQRRKIAEVKYKIHFLDLFILQHEDLKQLCMAEMAANPTCINIGAIKDTINIQFAEQAAENQPNDIDLLTQLKLECLSLDFALNERMELIKRSKQIWPLFQKHVRDKNGDQNGQRAIGFDPNELIAT